MPAYLVREHKKSQTRKHYTSISHKIARAQGWRRMGVTIRFQGLRRLGASCSEARLSCSCWDAIVPPDENALRRQPS